MARLGQLQAAYERAYNIGVELLEVLRQPPSEAALDQIVHLVEQREAAVTEAAGLFQPGDQEMFARELRSLVEQQRVLESELSRHKAMLQQACDLTVKAKASARGARQMVGPSQRSRFLNELR